MKFRLLCFKLLDYLWRTRKVTIVEADTPPEKIPKRNLVLAREGGEDWAVAFRCPCGCGKRLELLLVEEAKPRWSLTIDSRGRPTLHPSVWLKSGCHSHFWVRNGEIFWCK
jgi:hypothetical protein